MNCKHCGGEIHPMHPTGYGTFSWAHDTRGPHGGGSLCIVDGKFTGTSAEPDAHAVGAVILDK